MKEKSTKQIKTKIQETQQKIDVDNFKFRFYLDDMRQRLDFKSILTNSVVKTIAAIHYFIYPKKNIDNDA